MFTYGECFIDSIQYNIAMSHSKTNVELIIFKNNAIISAYKKNINGSFSYNNNKAKELFTIINNGLTSCNSKNARLVPFVLGVVTQHEFSKNKVSYKIQIYQNEIASVCINTGNIQIDLNYIEKITMPSNIPYVALTSVSKINKKVTDNFTEDDLDNVRIRSVQEIMLEKEDLTWLKKKKYFIINDDSTAEKLFTFLENYNGPIAYDTETTGLHINCFGKINSSYQKELIKYNSEHKDDTIRADKLVGAIFCVEPDVSYYFPASNRKFENLYEKGEYRDKLIENFKARYTIGEFKDKQSDFASYWRETKSEDITSDCILMERIRYILSNRHIVAHNGSFEWKVGWQYEIDTNLKDDTMILHQIMYKFRSTTSNMGEPSNLKYLSKVELGIDQWELSDFFPDWKADKKGEIRRRPGKARVIGVDFSYMDYEGTKIYAPTDGDATLELFLKYKKDLVTNHSEQEYLYNIEIIVACCIAYMEFYGHRLDESKILGVRDKTKAKIAIIEEEIRQLINYSNNEEIVAYNALKALYNKLDEEESKLSKEEVKSLTDSIVKATDELKDKIESNTEKQFNLASPKQVTELFFKPIEEGGLGYKVYGDKPSVAKNSIKPLLQELDDNGQPKNKVAVLYSEYKKEDTLLTKFFDSLPYFMYPGGFIFSSFGQISTATGRMSCKQPNAQQYPKNITKIVVPREDYIMLDADYSQIEYRVLTALAGNEELAKLFADPDSDYHTLMASLMYDVAYASVTSTMRSSAKSFNFGIPYGMGLGSLAILLTGKNTPKTRDEAAEKYEMYFKNQPKTRKFFDDVKEMALVNGYTRTHWNRYRYYSFTDKDGVVNNAKKASALRQAGNAIIQGTAADIFKISVARNFTYIRKNGLLGLFLIINMIHDEQLMEINVKELNVKKVLADIGRNMQFKVEGFPPLYIGAGIGPAWGYAKGKMAEIHPNLLQQIMDESDNLSIFNDKDNKNQNVKDVEKYFKDLVLEFRRNKVCEYLNKEENWHKPIHPAIAGLINLQFNYGRGDDVKKYAKSIGQIVTDEDFLKLNLDEFITENKLNVKSEYFLASLIAKEEELDKEYNDADSDEEAENNLEEEVLAEYSFCLVDDNNVFGSSVQDLIDIFGTCVLKEKKICGINMKNMYYKTKDRIIDYIADKECSETDEDALEVQFLLDGNILKRTGVYVKDVDASAMESMYKLNAS